MDYLTYTPLKNITSPFCATDTPSTCKDKNHFFSFPHKISYKHNSKGFRDEEWPNDLDNVIWCIGDSCTKGVGSPFLHTWPRVLQDKTGTRCLNIGIEGAANNLLYLIANQIIKTFKPKQIVVMWTHFHRRYEDPWIFKHFEKNTREEDINNFLSCFNGLNQSYSNICNLFIPEKRDFDQLNLCTNIFANYPILDYARDGLHFDIKTSEIIATYVVNNINKSLLHS